MKSTVFINISRIYGVENNQIRTGVEMSDVPEITDAWMRVIDGRIAGFGKMADLEIGSDHVVDLEGKVVLPSFVDVHTHTVFAETREQEFSDRLHGMTYQEIAERGGGILNSARKLRALSEEELYKRSKSRLRKLIELGTGAIEIKSGYGLDTESEKKMLRVARKLGEEFNLPVKTTFLGAHAVPERCNGNTDEYVREIIDEMLPEIVRSGLADYVDVFCEKGYFGVEHTVSIIEAAQKLGLKARIHVNQFNSIGGIQMAVQHKILSVEHLEEMSSEDFNFLENSDLFAVALPACSFFLKIPYTPVRELIKRNVRVVLASDFNPGSTPTGNMSFIFSLGCLYMKMTPEEVFNSVTINAAHCLELGDETGSISIGKRANFITLERGSSLATLAYFFADDILQDVYLNGVQMRM
ncbi:MAG: imidazolonepropionase [Bacteroidetes bacterium]|nr:imidazolonepropionase [Bacteroidota bacterium]